MAHRSPRALPRASYFASAAATACAAHCVLGPFVVVALPAFALGEALEPWILGAVLLIGGHVVWTGLRLHGRRTIAGVFATGVVVWAASVAGVLVALPEPATSAIGSAAVAAAIVWNARLRHRQTCSHELVPDSVP